MVELTDVAKAYWRTHVFFVLLLYTFNILYSLCHLYYSYPLFISKAFSSLRLCHDFTRKTIELRGYWVLVKGKLAYNLAAQALLLRCVIFINNMFLLGIRSMDVMMSGYF